MAATDTELTTAHRNCETSTIPRTTPAETHERGHTQEGDATGEASKPQATKTTPTETKPRSTSSATRLMKGQGKKKARGPHVRIYPMGIQNRTSQYRSGRLLDTQRPRRWPTRNGTHVMAEVPGRLARLQPEGVGKERLHVRTKNSSGAQGSIQKHQFKHLPTT